MIDRASITNWSVSHPWGQKSFVEQDLVISRVLVSIYSDPFLSEALAFRGGTALHKLYLAPQVRYSEDIDLVQVESGPIKPIVERLDAVLAWLPVEVDIDAVLRCWRRYITHGGKTVPTTKELLANMEEKLAFPEYCDDVKLMLRPGTDFSVDTAYSFVRDSFIDRLTTATITERV